MLPIIAAQRFSFGAIPPLTHKNILFLIRIRMINPPEDEVPSHVIVL